MNVGGTVYYLHADHLGSTSVTTDGSGALVNSQTYFAFGAIRSSAGNQVSDHGFTGQKFDAGDALMYYGARYYDPLLARFTQADTIVPGAGNPQSFNRYSYVLDNPVRYTDPTGNKYCDDDNDPSTCHYVPPVNPNPTATPAPSDGGEGGEATPTPTPFVCHQHWCRDDGGEGPSQPTATPTPAPVSPLPLYPTMSWRVSIPYSWGTAGEAHCDEETGACAGSPPESTGGIQYILAVDVTEGLGVTRLDFLNEEWSDMPGYAMSRQVTVVGLTSGTWALRLGSPLDDPKWKYLGQHHAQVDGHQSGFATRRIDRGSEYSSHIRRSTPACPNRHNDRRRG